MSELKPFPVKEFLPFLENTGATGAVIVLFKECEYSITTIGASKKKYDCMKDVGGQVESLILNETIYISDDFFVDGMPDSERIEGDFVNTRPIEDKKDEEIERLRDAIDSIKTWAKAYPVEQFPKPDLARVAELLAGSGITIDQIAADNFRHVLDGVMKIIKGVKP